MSAKLYIEKLTKMRFFRHKASLRDTEHSQPEVDNKSLAVKKSFRIGTGIRFRFVKLKNTYYASSDQFR